MFEREQDTSMTPDAVGVMYRRQTPSPADSRIALPSGSSIIAKYVLIGVS
ncbi:MAG: hypothetical protein M3094_00035 [Actinomycetia bacterium]|nr:hypothetical protein [Actinomycetes bacterium]